MTTTWPPERTIVQEARPYDPRYDVRTDAVAVYGVDASLPERIAAWQARGYRVHLMTGLAWGQYQDYLLGRWDGRDHWDEAQHQANGTPKQHGPDTPYMVPTPGYASYLKGLLRQAIDAGVEGIFLEEPEFWSYTGYGPAFERAWQATHGEPWRDPAVDPQSFVLAAQVKYRLYYDLIAGLCRAIKEYSAGRPGEGSMSRPDVRCYVATHSPLNYTAWAIVSPELSLRNIPELDGMVVQTWSFTARSQTFYEGHKRERLFPVAFLEYGSGVELARGSGRHLWFLTDPVEDRPNQGWDHYRAGYEATVAASLCWPEVGAFEVMPWPWRVFTARYPRRPDGSGGDPIPPLYATELLAIANALRTLPEGPVEWDRGTPGLGVLISDTMMLRRGGPGNDDLELSSFYGLALPLLLAGMPARPVGMELLAEGAGTGDVHTLLLSYDGMTPPSPAAHQALADWVRTGGLLLCFGPGDGPYETLPGWWNDATGGSGPWPDLFRRLGWATPPAAGIHPAGQGLVLIEPASPITLARSADGAGAVRARVREGLAALGPSAPAYREQGHLVVRRGPYLVAAALAEAPGAPDEAGALRLHGQYVDLFDGNLPLRREVTLPPGACAFLLDLERLDRGPFQRREIPASTTAQQRPRPPCVVAAAARIEDEQVGDRSLRFRATGPAGTMAAIRLRLPAAPATALAGGTALPAEWDASTSTVLLRHPNTPEGVPFDVRW